MIGGRSRTLAKDAIGRLPLTAELYQRWWAPQQVPGDGYSLERLEAALPGWTEAGARARSQAAAGHRLLVVGYLRWWLEFGCALASWLSGLGHAVDVGFLPYRQWTRPVSRFDLRRQAAHIRRVLSRAAGLFGAVDLFAPRGVRLPLELEEDLESLGRIDVQYTLQREDLDFDKRPEEATLFRLRGERNRAAARALWHWLSRNRGASVLVPNGSILEFGALYRTARYLRVPLATYEFGEQRERIWIARDGEVMRHDTAELWRRRGTTPITSDQRRRLEDLLRARRGGRPWSNFTRRWQVGEGGGPSAAAEALGLDRGRPVVLLCTNVVGDSLTLGRQVFTSGMAEWLSLTVRHFASRPQAQLIVRVHPGELLGAGHPSEEIVQAAVPRVPPHVVLVPPDSWINTYDLVDLADLGLVYTTTVGLEMAMAGIPVVVAGQTHYRGKGFTLDPAEPGAYLEAVDRLLASKGDSRLDPRQVETAWRYAYRYFFDFPMAFPWHIIQFWEDMESRPLDHVFTPEGRRAYAAAVERLVGGNEEAGGDSDGGRRGAR